MTDAGWSSLYAARFFIAALVPFGPFSIDPGLKQEEAAACTPAASAQ